MVETENQGLGAPDRRLSGAALKADSRLSPLHRPVPQIPHQEGGDDNGTYLVGLL